MSMIEKEMTVRYNRIFRSLDKIAKILHAPCFAGSCLQESMKSQL